MQEALNRYLEAIKADYALWQSYDKNLDEQALAVRAAMTKEFNEGLKIEEGKVYYKVIARSQASASVHSFIVKEDGPKFRKGDILKAAGWNAPAKNQARGNILGEYKVRWTGALYLR